MTPPRMHLLPASALGFKFSSYFYLACPRPIAYLSSKTKFIYNANAFPVKNGVSKLQKAGLPKLGCTNLEINGTKLAHFGAETSANRAVPVEKDENGTYTNGLERLEGINQGLLLRSTNLEKNGGNLADFQSNATANPAAAAESDGSATPGDGTESFEETDGEIGCGRSLKEGLEASPENNLDKEQSESSVINQKIYSPYSHDPFKLKKDNGLLNEEELDKLRILETYGYKHIFEHGLLVVKVMGIEHMKDTEELLTDSFAELMWGPLTYRPLLRLTVREHMLERRAFIPHAATLVGLYAEGQSKWMLAGTVELVFDSKGSVEHPPTPIPPKGAPYLCNMAVSKSLRRRGIGWYLLKASEELVQKIGPSEMYLHCRMVDKAPFNMYKKAGYNVVETDNLLILLTLQRRRHLMYKKLPEPT